jgi:hypothetical protein
VVTRRPGVDSASGRRVTGELCNHVQLITIAPRMPRAARAVLGGRLRACVQAQACLPSLSLLSWRSLLSSRQSAQVVGRRHKSHRGRARGRPLSVDRPWSPAGGKLAPARNHGSFPILSACSRPGFSGPWRRSVSPSGEVLVQAWRATSAVAFFPDACIAGRGRGRPHSCHGKPRFATNDRRRG